MDQQSTSTMLTDVPGEKEGEQLKSEETIAEPEAADEKPESKESTVNEINSSISEPETQSVPDLKIEITASLEGSKNDENILDNQEPSNTVNECKKTEITVQAITETCDETENSLKNEKDQESVAEKIDEKEELPVVTEVSNENQTNGASTEIAEVSESKNAAQTCESDVGKEINSLSEAECSIELSLSMDSVDGEIQQENLVKTEEKSIKDESTIAVTEEKPKEPTIEASKNEKTETVESPTEMIEFSLIEYTEENVEETTVSKSTAIEIIVQTNNDADSTISTGVTMKNTPSDKSTLEYDETPEIIDKKEALVPKNDNEDSVGISAAEEKKSNAEETRKSVEESPAMKIQSDASVVCKNDTSNSDKSSTLVASPATQRSVIQDIFDDWGDENPEEESQQASKSHDSVEMELKILLDDDKPVDEKYEENVKKILKEQPTVAEIERKQSESSGDGKATNSGITVETTESKESEKQRESFHSMETTTGIEGSRKLEKIIETTGKDRAIRQKPLAPRPGVKVPGFLLSSPIVSKTAVSKVLKERLREQQKDFDDPVKPDIFFVKKITQRLSHKLAAASAAQIPGLVPIPHSATKADAIRVTKSSAVSDEKKASNVDKELLAILEGDVDPDWSNLRAANVVDETKNGPATTDHNNPTKLDPLIERELALKQLLELPNSPGKKAAAKKTPVKTARTKNPKIAKIPRSATKKEANVETAEIGEEKSIEITEKQDFWENVKTTTQEIKADETRSGRKRKPTEKAREHEQNSTKRLKVLKGKSSGTKRSGNESDQSQTNDSLSLNSNDGANKISIEITENKTDIPPEIETSTEKRLNDSEIPEDVPKEETRVEPPEIAPKKVIATSNAKRKMPVGQKFARQKMPTKKTALGLKAKFPKGISKKTASKIITAKGQKQRNRENTGAETKPKKKANNEIDRLLQDEGVVNLLYDVEQTGKKRLVPITKSQTKVMDLQKIQRELKIRTKLVRNAVLRLRTSNISTSKVSPRSKRSTSYNSETQLSEKKITGEANKSGQSSATSPTDFIFPAKIRNAADASIIIRRHSSSSFSSASASPRASIDGPERLSFDATKNEESGGGTHLLRSNKRLHSREEEEKNRNNKKKKAQQQTENKRNRRRTAETPDTQIKSIDIEAVIAAANGGKNKNSTPAAAAAAAAALSGDFSVATTARAAKKIETKKNAKSGKQQTDANDEDSIGGIKNATRSNGAAGKIMPKSKKTIKGKVTFAKGSESFNRTEASEREDELSACLAEVVTALANDSGGPSRSRSTVPVNRYKTKGIASGVKTSEADGSKPKLESRVQFSNKEINVQRHGNLVQLLLTPSKTTNIRNGITLQVMQEIRENLSILKKDEECRVVLLTSTGSSFCEGLELSTILHENKEERRIRAQELANGVKEFIKSLATFNKPIVAGVQGSAIGLGVTMLPWFDLVIASDKATFSTPYGKLGQIAEGAAIFTLSHILGSAVTSELLLGGRTLTASEALRAGLVTRVLWPDRFQAELLPSLRAMSEQSSQSMEATKALLRHSLRKKLDAALESESYLLVQHWCSAECQAAITAYVDEHIQ